MRRQRKFILTAMPPLVWLLLCGHVFAGPYSAGMNDPGNVYDAPVPGFVGPHGIGKARLVDFDVDLEPIVQNPNNYVNPLFFAWANNVDSYYRADKLPPPNEDQFDDPSLALGPVTGDNFDIVSLGDLTAQKITQGNAPGNITLTLAKPIRNLTGADFVVFENGAVAQSNQGGAGAGGVFGELAYVEVSANGIDFIRFPSTSLTPSLVGGYGSINPTNVLNLAGKHANAYGDSWGTPFDLSQVGLAQITHIRIVDIPGNGAFKDNSGNSIYDAWLTFGSGGFDLEALGGISTSMTYQEWPQLQWLAASQRSEGDDPDGDGISNLLEYAFGRLPWLADAAEANPTCRIVSNINDSQAEFTFLRDERLTDLSYEVQVSSTMATNDWTTIATSTAGGPMTATPGHHPTLTETSASAIQSIGVIRKASVSVPTADSVSGRQFFRIQIKRLTSGGAGS
ncbi:MAG: hypothetical protein H8M99_08580 [Gloeobacteraceae cyanobacterium ES-bin-144]|nr:hypothetical protein [Verrucomicrobiales bacterium]